MDTNAMKARRWKRESFIRKEERCLEVIRGSVRKRVGRWRRSRRFRQT
jgi:hypothetical protein